MERFHFHTYGAYETDLNISFFGVFLWELLTCFAVIFLFGPIKVWLEIKEGTTSLKDI